MFIETYYDERARFPVSSREPAIPYPELVGEELALWQRYLPVRTELEKFPLWLQENMPRLVIKQLEEARKVPYCFERIEIWSRSGDPMAIGVIGGEQPRYFSIVRWGDAKLTLEQVRRRLRFEEWIFRLIPAGLVMIFLAAVWALVTHPGQFPESLGRTCMDLPTLLAGC